MEVERQFRSPQSIGPTALGTKSRDSTHSPGQSRASPHSATSSPPPYNDLPVVRTDDLGMVIEDEEAPTTPGRVVPVKQKADARKKRATRRNVSKHFAVEKKGKAKKRREENDNVKSDSEASERVTRKRCRRKRKGKQDSTTVIASQPQDTAAGLQDALSNFGNALAALDNVASTILPPPRIVNGLNINDLSSDSSLTPVPSDIGSDPFSSSSDDTPPTVLAFKSKRPKTSKTNPTKSPYFPSPHRQRSHFLSTLPFPPLDHSTFGLMQERLAHRPFELLIATIFLNKTPGERAMPVFYELMMRYPTPAALATAKVEDVSAMIYKLGFQNQRARKCVAMAQAWLLRPPEKGKRMRKLNYPVKGNGRDVSADEIIGDEDKRVAWEISHLPGLGPYSHDSWRMFCRDELRGLARDWLGDGAEGEGFEPEWKRVVPMDKELRAWCTWMWLKEGWVWDRETGIRTKASEELMRMARGGGVVLEDERQGPLVVKGAEEDKVKTGEDIGRIERPAGDFIPEA